MRGNIFHKLIMSSFSPRVILSAASRERCVANIKLLPSIFDENIKPKNFASVLIPLCVIDDEVCILYTKRSHQLKNHSGQVSFPGGKLDGSESVVEAALRETEEEIGIPRREIDVWAVMSTVQGRDKTMLVTPVVGEIRNFTSHKLTPNADEVEEVFTVPLSHLCNPNYHAHLDYTPRLPVYIYGKHNIWGLTGFMTHMFLQCLLTENVYKENFKRKKFTLEELMQSKL